MIDRQHLMIIREVNRAGSVTAAAARLNLSQSAISHAIAKLEDRHRVQVWRKKGRNLELTQAGSHLLELAERIVPDLEHGERILEEIARGRRGAMRIGMECHPCEKWLMRVTAPYLAHWPNVDIGVRTAFRFDGISALQAHEIDVLITPDPVHLPGLLFQPVFDYELLLVVHDDHPLAAQPHVEPINLSAETLLTVPVTPDRLDIFTRFLIPADCRPRAHQGVESIDLMLQLVVARRGVTVLPDWLLAEEAEGMPVKSLRIGRSGMRKSINVGLRAADMKIDYVKGFLEIVRAANSGLPKSARALKRSPRSPSSKQKT